MSWIKRMLGLNHKCVKKSKDPNDFKKCRLSTGWDLDDHYCRVCKCSTGHREYMSGTCNGCGGLDTQGYIGRTYRKIKINGKWKYQVKYQLNEYEIIDKWYKA